MLGKVLLLLCVVGAAAVSLLALAARLGFLVYLVPAVVLVSFTLALEPTERLLVQDLQQLAKITDVDNFAQFNYNLEDVEKYYSSTTFRDYKLLEFFTAGPYTIYFSAQLQLSSLIFEHF